MQPIHTLPKRQKIILALCGLVPSTIGVIALVGWLTGSEILTSFDFDYIPMAPNTALAFLLLGLSLLLLVATRNPKGFLIVRLGSALVFILSTLRLAEFILGINLSVDQWLINVPGHNLGLAPIGRMAFFTALTLLFASTTLFILTFSGRARLLELMAGILAVGVTFVGMVFSLGYLYRTPLLYGGPSIPMALNTALAFIILGIGLVWTALIREIQQRREAELIRTQLAAIVESSDDAILSKTLDGVVSSWNSGAVRIYGFTAEEIVGRHISLLVPPGKENESQEVISRIKSGQTIDHFETQRRRKDGQIIDVSLTISPVRDQTGAIIAASTIARDITARKKQLEEIKRMQVFLDSIVENIPNMVFVKEARELRFVRFNKAGEELLGYSKAELIGKNDYDFFPSEEADFFTNKDRQVLQKGNLLDIPEEPIQTKHQGTRLLHTKKIPILDQEGKPEFLLGISEDITERKLAEEAILRAKDELELRVQERTAELSKTIEALHREIAEHKATAEALRKSEEQLLQSQKMEAIGRLAGGVAHDFNNLLTAMLGYSEILLSRLSPEESLRGEVEEIRKSAMRAASLTSQLLAFSRKQVLQPRVISLNTIVSDMEKMLRRLIGEDIELNTSTPPDLDNILADPGQIEQVILNLAVNSKDAMPSGGQLILETSNVFLDQNYASQHTSVRPGPYVMLAVSDTGHGMDQETVARIFEPFFTTKGPGKGTGLGLSTVYGIVKQSGGNIWVYSEPGKGTTFKIYFPQVKSATDQSLRQSGPGGHYYQGSETILLVEDEEQVRNLVRRILSEQGYTVFEAVNAQQALKIAQNHRAKIDLLLTDIVMPGLTGIGLAQRVQQLHPEIKILYMSGYTDSAVFQKGWLESDTFFLQKPFTPEALARKVREALENQPAELKEK